ncbi:MAG: FtsX-like permease family protein, partial [bacterium]
GTPEGNQRFILVNLKSAMGLFQTDKVRKIVVFFRERGGENRQCVDMEGSKTAISNLFPNGNYHIKTWQELNNYYNSVRAIYNTIFGFIGIVMAIVVILSIYNTMYMVVVERTREIGTLMAVGTPRRYVLLLFLFEGLIVAVVGAILGYGGTYIASRIINHAGLVMPPPPGGTQGYPLLIQAVYLNWIYIAFFIMFNTIVACFWPAYKGAKMAIVKALYHV